MTETPTSMYTFKVPTAHMNYDMSSDETSNSETGEPEILDQKSKNKSTKPLINVPLPYKEPEWSGLPPPNYYFEIIKNGTLVSNLPIKSPFLTFGRLEGCDVIFEHPSVSRYHAIIQYCKGDDTHPKGFYLYDLGSTHNTFLNKSAVNPKVYYKLKVGYILKFGGSSRLHIFQGPEEEEETEIKKPAEAKQTEEEACSWGISEDASDEEECETINPFALSTANEELYLEDPKKTLRGWFEREGYEVEYKVEEKGFKSFSCTLQLPVDTPTGEFMTVEASVSGKKKEAVVACALEACRTLDRMGLLRQSHHESRERKKNWEENDYYDSDEDTFYDRTGEIEKRREMRKRLAKKTDVENFQTLETKLKALVTEIEEINKKVLAFSEMNAQSSTDTNEDSLETYMSSLTQSSSIPTDKFERRKLKLRLMEAEKEKAHLEKLLDIARPTKLPPVVKHPGIIGKRLKSKLQLPTKKSKPDVKPVKNDNEDMEEVESDPENETAEKSSSLPETPTSQSKESDSPEESKKYGLILNTRNETDTVVKNVSLPTEGTESTDTKSCPANIVKSMDIVDDIKEKDGDKMDSEVMVPSVKRVKKDQSRKPKKELDVYKADNNDYCTWTPPKNQSGDGITHLNAKYGY